MRIGLRQAECLVWMGICTHSNDVVYDAFMFCKYIV